MVCVSDAIRAAFEARHGVRLRARLGIGRDGEVYLTDEVEAPDFSEEVWVQWREQKQEEFGDRWSDVDFVLAELTRLTGLVMLDVNPGNIKFADANTP
jgi:hypothetical protein